MKFRQKLKKVHTITLLDISMIMNKVLGFINGLIDKNGFSKSNILVGRWPSAMGLEIHFVN